MNRRRKYPTPSPSADQFAPFHFATLVMEMPPQLVKVPLT